MQITVLFHVHLISDAGCSVLHHRERRIDHWILQCRCNAWSCLGKSLIWRVVQERSGRVEVLHWVQSFVLKEAEKWWVPASAGSRDWDVGLLERVQRASMWGKASPERNALTVRCGSFSQQARAGLAVEVGAMEESQVAPPRWQEGGLSLSCRNGLRASLRSIPLFTYTQDHRGPSGWP